MIANISFGMITLVYRFNFNCQKKFSVSKFGYKHEIEV